MSKADELRKTLESSSGLMILSRWQVKLILDEISSLEKQIQEYKRNDETQWHIKMEAKNEKQNGMGEEES